MRFSTGSKQRKLAFVMLYVWRLFQIRDEFTSVLSGFRLFHDYLVDHFCKIEAEKLSFLFRNQHTVRAEKYAALRDLLGDPGGPNGKSEAVRSGKLVVLPSTCIGGQS